MSTRVRAVCTKCLSDVSPQDLHAGIAERLPITARFYGEDDAEETLARLRVVEDASPDGGFSAYLLHYREDNGRPLRIERECMSTRFKQEVQSLLDAIEDNEEDDVEVVRDCLSRAVEVAIIELTMSDTEGIGWPLAIAAAAYLAGRGAGLIQADAEGWMQPHGRDVRHLLDAD